MRSRGAMWALLGLLLAGCGAYPFIWSRAYSFAGNEWGPDSKVTFRPDSVSLSPSGASTAVIALRYGVNASVEELPLVVDTESPTDGYFRSDTIRVRLLPVKERSGANGTIGIFETCDTLRLPLRAKPGWELTVRPLTEESVKGLFSISLSLYK